MYAVLGLVAVVPLFVIWRWTSVRRGAQQRDERILQTLDQIGQKLDAGETVSVDEVRQLARRPEVRHMLFTALREMDRSDLIPADFSSSIDQGASALAYWMMHPNELQDAPERIEHVETVVHSVNGAPREFHVYRFRMAEGHWAGSGWLLGLAGPMADATADAYSQLPGAFSRVSDGEGTIEPAALIDCYVGFLEAKGIAA